MGMFLHVCGLFTAVYAMKRDNIRTSVQGQVKVVNVNPRVGQKQIGRVDPNSWANKPVPQTVGGVAEFSDSTLHPDAREFVPRRNVNAFDPQLVTGVPKSHACSSVSINNVSVFGGQPATKRLNAYASGFKSWYTESKGRGPQCFQCGTDMK